MCHIAAKFIPQILTNDQKQRPINMCLELWEKANEDSTFICRIITGDKSWIYGYDPETKQQSSQWKSLQSPRAQKAQKVWSWTKSMLIVFSTWSDLFTVNLFQHSDQLRLLRILWCFETLERKCATEKTGILVQPQLAPSSQHLPDHMFLQTTEFVT
jgi:hypothetical protein